MLCYGNINADKISINTRNDSKKKKSSASSSSTRSLSSRRSRSGTDDCSPSNCSVDRSELSPLDPDVVIRRRLRRLRQTLKKYTAVQTSMRKEMRTCKSKISEQQKQLLEFANRFDDVDKKNEETTRKFSTLLQVNPNIIPFKRILFLVSEIFIVFSHFFRLLNPCLWSKFFISENSRMSTNN